MQCDDFESRLNDVLDERRPPAEDAPLAEHAAACPMCHRLLRSVEQLLGVVASFPSLEDEGDLAPRVLAGWEQDRRRRRRLLPLAIPLGVVAAALLIVAIVRPWAAQENGAIVHQDPNEGVNVPGGAVEAQDVDRPREQGPNPAIVENDPASHEPVTPQRPPVETRPRSIVLADRAGRLAGELVLLGAGVAPPYEKAPAPEPQSPELVVAADPPIWIDQVRPLGDTMAAALSALRRTLPQIPDEPPSS